MSGFGGYDEGYAECPCFWGREPGSLVREVMSLERGLDEVAVLDLGCGEGKNAVCLARAGARVTAVDVSALALANARKAWPDEHRVRWVQADVAGLDLGDQVFGVVLAYGLLHCLPGREAIEETINFMKRRTAPGGWNVVCCFNSRHQDLEQAHPGFRPCLLPHGAYVAAYEGWEIVTATDTDLHETHPHNNVPHTHSMTRLLAKKAKAPA